MSFLNIPHIPFILLVTSNWMVAYLACSEIEKLKLRLHNLEVGKCKGGAA